MTPCTTCARHLRDADPACPFCGTTRASASPGGSPRAFPRAFGRVGGAVTALVLAACYGSPYGFDTGADRDPDGDGYGAGIDCDEDDAAISPDAPEICDDTVDNDCDGKIDADDEACATAKK